MCIKFMNITFTFQYPNGWYSTFWCCIHRIVLHIHSNMGKPILLPVWISISRIYYTYYILLTNIHRHGLFPIVWRGEAKP